MIMSTELWIHILSIILIKSQSTVKFSVFTGLINFSDIWIKETILGFFKEQCINISDNDKKNF